MEELDLKKLEIRIDELITTITSLQDENKSLRTNTSDLEQERATLTEKTELARERVASMILKLKAMEDA